MQDWVQLHHTQPLAFKSQQNKVEQKCIKYVLNICSQQCVNGIRRTLGIICIANLLFADDRAKETQSQ